MQTVSTVNSWEIKPDTPDVNYTIISETHEGLVSLIQGDTEMYFPDNKFKPAILADTLLNTFFKHQIVTLDAYDRKGRGMLHYDPEKGIYTGKAEIWLKGIIAQILKDEATPKRVKDTIELIQINTAVDPEQFIQPTHITVMNNGCYDWHLGQLVEWSPLFCATKRLEFSYDPEATCPAIMKYLDEVNPTWEETGESAKEALLEWVSYFLRDEFTVHRFVILVGGQGTGKSTFNNLVIKFLGEENLCFMSVQALSTYRFNVSRLKGKMGNICNDIGSTALKDAGILKGLTGADHHEAEQKYGTDSVKFNFTGKMMFSTNTVPTSYDVDESWHMRAVLIEFPVTFRNTDKEDRGLLSKLTTPEEFSGLFNLCVERLPIFLDRKKLAGEPPVEIRKLNYLKKSDSASYFVELCLQEEEGAVFSTMELYSVYTRMCHDEIGSLPKGSDAFGKTLKRVMTYGFNELTRMEDNRPRMAWHNVGIRPEYLKYLNPGSEKKKEASPIKYTGDLVRDTQSIINHQTGKQITETYLGTKLQELGYNLTKTEIQQKLLNTPEGQRHIKRLKSTYSLKGEVE